MQHQVGYRGKADSVATVPASGCRGVSVKLSRRMPRSRHRTRQRIPPTECSVSFQLSLYQISLCMAALLLPKLMDNHGQPSGLNLASLWVARFWGNDMGCPALGIRHIFSVTTIACLAVGGLLAAAPSCPAAAADWPQAHSDVPADPDVLFGTLPDGMRYAILNHATPKGAVAMRLCIEAGSLQEGDAQQGLAHFLEHMAFRGSRHVPEDQVWPAL